MPQFARATLAVAFAMITAGCAHRPPRNIREVRGGGPVNTGPVSVRPGNTLRADSSFARSVGECTYTATLRGHVHETHYGSAGPPFGALTFSPAVTIATEVACGSERPVIRATKSLESEDLSIEQMTQALDATGAISVPLDRRTCTFRPDIAISGDTVFIANVDETCSH